jgi:hypothetical protein
MNNRRRKTLEAVFRDPVSGSIAWADIEALFVGCGCRIIEGSGSRVRFEKDGVFGSFHRPHPAKETKKYQIRIVRDFLIELRITQ